MGGKKKEREISHNSWISSFSWKNEKSCQHWASFLRGSALPGCRCGYGVEYGYGVGRGMESLSLRLSVTCHLSSCMCY